MLLSPRSRHRDDDSDEENKEEDDMSIASVGNEFFSDYDLQDDEEEVIAPYDEEELLGHHKSCSKLNRGMLKDKNLRIQVPFGNRDTELGLPKFALKNSTPATYLLEEAAHTLSSKVVNSILNDYHRIYLVIKSCHRVRCLIGEACMGT